MVTATVVEHGAIVRQTALAIPPCDVSTAGRSATGSASVQ